MTRQGNKTQIYWLRTGCSNYDTPLRQ